MAATSLGFAVGIHARATFDTPERARHVIVLYMLAILASSCSVQVPTRERFNLEHPPEGWYRWQDVAHNVSVWMPGDWHPLKQLPGDDVLHGLTLFPEDESQGAVWLEIVEPVDFRADPRDPVILQDGGGSRYPESAYAISTDRIEVPCARYVGAFRSIPADQVNHICVLPGLPDKKKPYDYVLNLATKQQWEPTLLSAWEGIVLSFALEQAVQPEQQQRSVTEQPLPTLSVP